MLKVENLTFGYSKKQTTIKDVALSLDKGDVGVVLGPNGAGKSTLFKNILGLLKPQSGSVSIDGKDMINISSKERIYVWNEIRDLTESGIETASDRGKHREFYEYCYRIYQFGGELAYSFTWSQWVDILDRSAALRDERFVAWLAKTDKKINTENLRMLLLILTMYLEKRDLSVFDDDEVIERFDFLFTIVEQWNELFRKYFESKKSKLSDARREKFTKYKKKYISEVLDNSKFSAVSDLPRICEDAFKKYFVDIDTSGNFKK